MDIVEYRNLQEFVIHSLKELGEIAEVLVKLDRPDHWKNELGDLCAFGILPMLKLANMSFDDAVKIGIERKNRKMIKEHNKEIKG